ncbi:MAG: hypothetical protein Q9166_007452 [cf. Caloplaca sp. 2 TL-2023]
MDQAERIPQPSVVRSAHRSTIRFDPTDRSLRHDSRQMAGHNIKGTAVDATDTLGLLLPSMTSVPLPASANPNLSPRNRLPVPGKMKGMVDACLKEKHQEVKQRLQVARSLSNEMEIQTLLDEQDTLLRKKNMVQLAALMNKPHNAQREQQSEMLMSRILGEGNRQSLVIAPEPIDTVNKMAKMVSRLDDWIRYEEAQPDPANARRVTLERGLIIQAMRQVRNMRILLQTSHGTEYQERGQGVAIRGKDASGFRCRSGDPVPQTLLAMLDGMIKQVGQSSRRVAELELHYPIDSRRTYKRSTIEDRCLTLHVNAQQLVANTELLTRQRLQLGLEELHGLNEGIYKASQSLGQPSSGAEEFDISMDVEANQQSTVNGKGEDVFPYYTEWELDEDELEASLP